MVEILVDGLLIDDESGEIIGDVPGGDKAAFVASQFAYCKAQIKAYEQAVAIYQQALFKYQEGKTATYGDFRVSLRQSRRGKFDVDEFRKFAAVAEFTHNDLRQALIAARTFDLKALPEEIRTVVERLTTEELTRPFAIVETVRRPAPVIEDSRRVS